MDIRRLVSIGQGWQGANFASGQRGPRDMELSDILQHVGKYDTPQRQALALAYYADYMAGLVRSEALYFRTEWANNYLDISGDYVSDLVAAISSRVEILSGLVAELDKARAELDAASFPAVR